jgi:hypothetical protein
VDNDTNVLKLQGYYYVNLNGRHASADYIAILLYKNGVLKTVGGLSGHNFLEHDQRVITVDGSSIQAFLGGLCHN